MHVHSHRRGGRGHLHRREYVFWRLGPGIHHHVRSGHSRGRAAPLTVTASSGSFTQGGTPPAISAAYSGFQNGETASSLTDPAHVLDDGDQLERGRYVPVDVQWRP